MKWNDLFYNKHFPLLNSGNDLLLAELLGIDDLLFLAPSDKKSAHSSATRTPGMEWHKYGDLRWPTDSTWIELEGGVGILVLRSFIEEEDSQPVELSGLLQCPLQLIDTFYRGDDFARSVDDLHASLVNSQRDCAEGGGPVYVQSYRLYQRMPSGDVQMVADYTDLLNRDGVQVPGWRIARVDGGVIESARMSLHRLFVARQLYGRWVPFIEIDQCEDATPIKVEEGEPIPLWETFHPRRILKTRPYLNIAGFTLTNGAIQFEDFERIIGAIRLGMNQESLCIEREQRGLGKTFWFHESINNSCIGAVMHREMGGAIYVIPDPLVEEFDNTDCSEVRISDITLPFDHTFVKFTPPDPIFLDEGCVVDGCYIVRQSAELLITVTSKRIGVSYSNSIPLTAIDPIFSIHLPTDDPEMTVLKAVELGVSDYLEKNSPPEEDHSHTIELPHGSTGRVDDVRKINRALRCDRYLLQKPSFDRCLNIIINAACFISFRPEDIEDSWAGEPSADVVSASEATVTGRHAQARKDAAIAKLERGDHTRIKICGAKLFSDRRGEATGTHAAPLSHWRRGHWRRQRHGVGLAFVTLKWIRPTIVHKDSGTPVDARIYDV